MGYPFVLHKKNNLQDKQGTKKWYATAKSGTPVDEEIMTKMATEDTTMADVELAAAAKLIARWVHNQIVQGKRAKIPGLGTFRITFGSEGVEDIRDFNTSLIRNVKLSLIPDKRLREDILRDLRFENAGVVDEGTYYGSLENYKQVKGLTTPSTGGTDTTPDDGEEEDGNQQLG